MLHPERRRENVRQLAYEEGFHDGYAQALSEMPEIVRCKDCRFHDNPEESASVTYWMPCDECEMDDNWFCGCGKRKDGDRNG